MYKIVLKNGVTLPSRTVARIFELSTIVDRILPKRLCFFNVLLIFIPHVVPFHPHKLLEQVSFVNWPQGVLIFDINC